VRDRPRRVSLVDPDGKPVVGAEMWDQVQWPAYAPFTGTWDAGVHTRPTKLRAASFPLTGLHPNRVQHITFVKEDRRLIALLLARGDGASPYTVRMQPWGTVIGRILDANGKSLAEAGIVIKADGADPCEQVGCKTDAEGRFRAERIIPGLSYSAEIYGHSRLIGKAFAKLVLRAEEVRDLGVIRTKPSVDAKSGTKPGN